MSTSSPSSETMCTSTDDCFCHEHERQSRSPNSSQAQRSTSSAGSLSISLSVSDRRRLVTQEHLLEGVGSKSEAQGLERNDLLRRDVAEVDLRAERADEPGLGRL